MSSVRSLISFGASRVKPSLVAGQVINRRPVEVLPRPDLTTQRLVFRPLTAGDEPAFTAALDRSRELLRRWIPTNHECESDAHFFNRTMMRARVQQLEGNGWRRAAFIDGGDRHGRFLGMFNLIKIQRGLEWSCEANWWIDSQLSGQGYASEGVQGMLDFALGQHPMGLGMHRVRAMICAQNHASVRIAAKAGFMPNGRHELLSINKAIVSHDEYECLAH